MSYFPDHPNLKVGDLVRYDMNFTGQSELWRIEPEGLAIVLDLIASRYVKLKVFGRDLPICLLARDAGMTICNSPKENAS